MCVGRVAVTRHSCNLNFRRTHMHGFQLQVDVLVHHSAVLTADCRSRLAAKQIHSSRVAYSLPIATASMTNIR
jgi:hypothetical protein